MTWVRSWLGALSYTVGLTVRTVGTVVNGAEIDHVQVDFSTRLDISVQGPPSPPSVTAQDRSALLPQSQSTPTVAPATMEAPPTSILLRDGCAEPHVLTVDDFSPEDIRDVYGAGESSFP